MLFIQFFRQFETTNLRFWFAEMKRQKHKFCDEKQQNNAKRKFKKLLSSNFLWTSHTESWCNMLQTAERWRKMLMSWCQMNTLFRRISILIFATPNQRNVLAKARDTICERECKLLRTHFHWKFIFTYSSLCCEKLPLLKKEIKMININFLIKINQ